MLIPNQKYLSRLPIEFRARLDTGQTGVEP
jgi:hypothetical protein